MYCQIAFRHEVCFMRKAFILLFCHCSLAFLHKWILLLSTSSQNIVFIFHIQYSSASQCFTGTVLSRAQRDPLVRFISIYSFNPSLFENTKISRQTHTHTHTLFSLNCHFPSSSHFYQLIKSQRGTFSLCSVIQHPHLTLWRLPGD